jgi:hypothetical protein
MMQKCHAASCRPAELRTCAAVNGLPRLAVHVAFLTPRKQPITELL